MNLQSIIGFLTSPLGFIILVGLFSTVTRLFKSAQEQQAKKRELQKFREAQKDAIRTGHGTESDQNASLDIAQSKQATWDQKQQARRDRIEQLRQQRIDQLKKIRQKRSGTSPSTPAQQASKPSQASPRSTPSPVQQRAAQTPRPKPTPRPQQPAATIVQQPAPRRRPRPQVIPQAKAQPQPKQQTAPSASLDTASPIHSSTIGSKAAKQRSSTRSRFKQDLRSAIIAKEVLGTPIGLRSPEDAASGIG